LWPATTNLKDVYAFVFDKSAKAMVGFEAAYVARKDVHMLENVKLLRHAITRLDQFRRMKVRQWAKDEKLKLNQEKPNP
jgi:hypothetical protein